MKDVHTEHCCILHGCKYMYDTFGAEHGLECTVTSGKLKQSFPCETCEMEHVEGIPDPNDPDYDILKMNEVELRDEIRKLRGLMREFQ